MHASWGTVALLGVLAAAACSSSSGQGTSSTGSGGAGGGSITGAGGSAGGAGGGSGGAMADDLDVTPDDFACIKNWTPVRQFFLTNKLGNLQGALDVAQAPNGGTYPVGTIIQLVPTEAMVKRKAGWSPETNDWEFFALSVSAKGTTIDARGKSDVVNAFGGNCLDCHSKAAPQWDLICEKTHGCDPLPFSDSFIKSVQDSDPRCP